MKYFEVLLAVGVYGAVVSSEVSSDKKNSTLSCNLDEERYYQICIEFGNLKFIRHYVPTSGRYLYFNRKIISIAPRAFNYLQITDLNIFTGEESIRLESESFSYLPNVRTLIIKTPIKPMKKNLFKELDSLKNLDVKFDGLEFRLEEAVSGLENLRSLILKNCNLTRILPSTFSSFKKLEFLDLSSNLLSYIALNAFSGAFNPNVNPRTFLILDNNQITIITEGAFSGLIIGTVSMRNNSLSYILKGAFKNLRVNQLYISGNPILNVERYAFAGSNISKLYLGKSSITYDTDSWNIPYFTQLVPTD